jgi:hypothetical protein
MRIILLFLVLGFSSVYAESPWDGKVAAKAEGSNYLVFGDDVNVRKSSDTSSDALFRLQAGESVKILRKTKVLQVIDGDPEYWYEIDASGKTGMVWGGLLADGAFRTNSTLLLVRNLGVKNSECELRVLRDGRDVSRTNWHSGPVSGETPFTLIFLPVTGFDRPPQLFFYLDYFVFSEIEYGYESRALFTLSGNGSPDFQFSWTTAFNDPPACSETSFLLPGDNLPADKKIKRGIYSGKRNSILLLDHDYQMDSPGSDEYRLREYRWTGSRFLSAE